MNLRHRLASLLRAAADTLDPARSVTIRITGDSRAARAAIADAELAIRQRALHGRPERTVRRWEGSA